MSVQTEDTSTPPVVPTPEVETAPATPAPVDGDEASIAALPDWARAALTKANGEAANYRTRLRDAETKLSEAKTPEEFEAAVAEVKMENAKLERSVTVSNVAREFNLPQELADVLKGDTEVELKAHAKLLQKFAVSSTPDSLGGGLTPDVEDDGEMDPHKLARRSRR